MKNSPSFRRKPESPSIGHDRDLKDPGFRRGDVPSQDVPSQRAGVA